jgi:SSS family solute:Na+ symporter
MYLAVKFQWISASFLTLSGAASDMAANFWRAWWAWLITFVVTIFISVFTKKRPEAELVGLVKGLTAEAILEPVPLFKRPAFYAVISLLVFVVLNIIFW